MPVVGALFVTLFAGFVDFFVKFFTQAVAIRLAFAAMMVAGFAVLVTSIQAAMALLTYAIPEGLATVLLFVLPGNVNSCIGAVIATEATCVGFRLYMLGLGR